jgi:hypothetical protein
MNPPHTLMRVGLTFATLSLVSGCGSSGQRASGTAASNRPSPFVLTTEEIATVPGILNAQDAVQALRPHFLRTRGSTSSIAGGLVTTGGAGGRRAGQRQSGQPGASGQSQPSARAPSTPEDPGIVVYLDRQRYGAVQTLREIPVATIEEIRFLNVGEANSLFGMGHPHGVIQIITKRSPNPQ